jgi:hypothetical protein
MAISVYAFGTGSKRAKIFKEIYYSIEDIDGIGVLYTKTGEYSAILKIQNPVQKFCANIDNYYDYSSLMAALMATLGEGYAFHKQDVFTRKKYKAEEESNKEFLSESYFRYFSGREYTDCTTYITITQENKKSRLMSYDNRKWNDFLVKINKIKDLLKDRQIPQRFLTKEEVKDFTNRFLVQDYTCENISLNNFNVREDNIGVGDRKFKVYSLVDVDSIVVPSCTTLHQYLGKQRNHAC